LSSPPARVASWWGNSAGRKTILAGIATDSAGGEITSPNQIVRELPEPIIGFRYFLFAPPTREQVWPDCCIKVPPEFIPPARPIPTLEEWEKAGRPDTLEEWKKAVHPE